MWIEAGQDPTAFYTFTLSEVALIVKATMARRDAGHERQRILSHELAGLIAVAYHDPQNFPKYEPLQKMQGRDEKPTESDNAKIRGFFIYHAMRSSQ